MASQGGNIILSQIENEYHGLGTPGAEYILVLPFTSLLLSLFCFCLLCFIFPLLFCMDDNYIDTEWCGKLAASLDIGIPWMMCNGEYPSLKY